MPAAFPAPDEPAPPGSLSGRPTWRSGELPADARRLGLSAWVAPELQLASNLRPEKRLHRLLAWVGLVVMLAVVLAPVISLLR